MQIDSQDWTIIGGALVSLAGILAGCLKVIHSGFMSFFGYMKPKVDGFFDGHVDAIRTAKTLLVETTSNISSIRSELHDHTGMINDIHEATCPDKKKTRGPSNA